MQILILGFGTLMALIGLVILGRPDVIFGALGRYSKSLYLHVSAVVIRLVLGAALIGHAAESRYPATLEALGWLFIVAAVVLGLMGRTRFKQLMDWAMSLANSFGRFAGFMALVFGGFLIHAVI
jgi:hypothetical protein